MVAVYGVTQNSDLEFLKSLNLPILLMVCAVGVFWAEARQYSEVGGQKRVPKNVKVEKNAESGLATMIKPVIMKIVRGTL